MSLSDEIYLTMYIDLITFIIYHISLIILIIILFSYLFYLILILIRWDKFSYNLLY